MKVHFFSDISENTGREAAHQTDVDLPGYSLLVPGFQEK